MPSVYQKTWMLKIAGLPNQVLLTLAISILPLGVGELRSAPVRSVGYGGPVFDLGWVVLSCPLFDMIIWIFHKGMPQP